MIPRAAPAHGESGWSLLEMLVTSAITITLLGTVLTAYDAARKTCRENEARAAIQISTRAGIDRLLAELRLAGLVTGDPGDSFEPVEGAWDTAIAFSGEIGAGRGPAPVVVAYFLAHPGAVDPGHLDLRLGRSGAEPETAPAVRIPGVAVVQDNPPYTLYRVVRPRDSATSPSSREPAGEPLIEPVADDIRSLRFRYLDDDQASLGPETYARPDDDIGGEEATRTLRARIRRVAVELTGAPSGCGSGCGEVVLESSVSPENLAAWKMRGPSRALPGSPP